MAIPNVRPELPLRAKVRVGDKDERGYPRALDHFISDDSDFPALAGDKPRQLRIRFPYADLESCFSSGLEKWMKGRKGNILGCYTKGDGTAHRLGKTRDANGLVVLDPTPGSERLSMPCAAQACEFYGKERHQGCRPIARLNFLLVGDSRVDSVWRFETKSLNNYETIAGVLGQYRDLRDHVFLLTARRVKQGTKEYTLVDITEESPAALAPAGDAAARTAASAGESQAAPPEAASSPAEPVDHRARVIAALTALGQDPRSPSIVEWVGLQGYEAAADALERRLAAKAAE